MPQTFKRLGAKMGATTDKCSAKVPIKPKDWPANDRERFLDEVVRLLKDFVSDARGRTPNFPIKSGVSWFNG